MPNKIMWDSNPAFTTLLSTTLNSLADGSSETAETDIDNTAGDMFMDILITLAAQGSARDEGGHVLVELLYSQDDSTYDYGDDSRDPSPVTIVGHAVFDAATTAGSIHLLQIPVVPGYYHLRVTNNTGQAFAAASNIVAYRLYSPEVQ